MPSQPRQTRPKELIFVNHEAVSQHPGETHDNLRQESDRTTGKRVLVDDEKVDMEIIILNPRRDKRTRDESGSKSKSASKSATQQDDKANLGEPIPGPNEQQPATSSTLNERLLKRLEKQYGQKRIVQADDNTYVDYMDYF